MNACCRRLLPHVLVLVAAFAVATGCDRSRVPVELGSVRVEGALAEPLREAGIEPVEIEHAARTALVRAGFRSGEPARAHRARVEVIAVRLAPPTLPGGAPRAEVMLEIAMAPHGGTSGGEGREVATGGAAVSPGGLGAAWGDALAAAARQAAEGLALGYTLEARSSEALIRELGSADPRARAHAMRILADRGSTAAVPALLERLRDPDPDELQRAIGALARLRDLRAVGPLIEVAQRGDGAFTAQLAHILGDIGGPEALGYLLTIEGGHTDPRVRAAARDALAAMRGREAPAAASR